jgi:5-hydroxyisourate hydrolase
LTQNGAELTRQTTNEEGRCAALLTGAEFKAGIYELTFLVGPYFDRTGQATTDPKFLDDITIRFGISDSAEKYHVPLLLAPHSYSTYRGS